LVSLAIEAMTFGRVNIMNRQFQARGLNFYSYRLYLRNTLADLEKMSAAEAPWKWLEYRVNNPATGLSTIYTLDIADRTLCKTRTTLFITALIRHLKERIAVPEMYRHLDVFDPAQTEEALKTKIKNYGKKSIAFLHVLLLSKRQPLLPLELLESEYTTWLLNGFPAWRKEHPHSNIIQMMEDVLGGGDKYAAYTAMREIFAIALSPSPASRQ
jgi:hypothetical protein